MSTRNIYRLVSIIVILSLTLAASSTSTAQVSRRESITLTLQAPVYKLTQTADGYTVIDAEAFAMTSAPGQASLPHRLIDVALPPDVAWDSLSLSVRDVRTASLPGAHKIRIAGPDRSDTGIVLDLEAVPETEPLALARIVATGQMRKWRTARVDYAPFRYDPATGQLDVVEQATVELSFARTADAPSAKELADTVMDDVAAQQFVNYDAARAWYPPGDQPNVTYDYVIITTNAIESGSTKLSSFVADKQADGYKVLVVTEDDYGSLTGQAPNGRAEKVRKWLQNNYVAYAIKYVLLIGDPTPDGAGATDLPMKMCWPRNDESDSDKESPTDYFFADLTGDWNKDGDQYYGEYVGDWGVPGGVNLAPEVYVGRIPFYGSYSDLDSILQKTIDYANESSTSWRKSILLPMGFQAAGYDGAPLAQQMWNDYLSAAGYSRWTQYQQGSDACSLDSTYSSNQELRGGTVVRDRWAANDYGIVAWWGHGSPTETAVGYGGCWDGILFNSTQTSSLDDDHPAFVYQNSCTNGYPEDSANLQYSILKRGGIATVSATRVSWFNTSVLYGYFDGSTTNSGIGYEYVHRVADGLTASEALYKAKSSMTPESNSRLMNYTDFNLYGDPAISIEKASEASHFTYIPAVIKQVAATPWTTIVSENFEGSFPGAWTVSDNDGSTNGTYYWAKRNCRAYAGSYSGWGVGGGANGAALGCGSNYPNNADSWMVYGPFSLVGATAAELNFKLWLNSQSSLDGVSRYASVNGTSFYGTFTTGNTGGWIDRTLDLDSAPTLGNLLGRSSVWIALRFRSDGSTNYAEGGYVDNIVLRKCTYTTCTTSAPAVDSSPGQIVEVPAAVTLIK